MFPGAFLFFILGLFVGSFLNVVVFRYGSRSFLSGRSQCGSCGKTLCWFEIIPLISFFLQRGRCRGCKSKISWQYPLVEFLTGLVFVAVFWKYSFDFSFLFTNYYLLITDLLIWSLLIVLSVYDINHKILPNGLIIIFLFLSLLRFSSCFLSSVPCSMFHVSSFWDFLGGPLLAVPFALLWFFSRGKAMGLGDAKLLLGFSWFVGFANGLSAIILGFWIGASVALVALCLKAFVSARVPPTTFSEKWWGVVSTHFYSLKSAVKNLTMKSELPLAPFLVSGLFIVYVFEIDVTGLSLIMNLGT